LLVCRDITERKHRERELEALNTRLELALTETDTGVWSWDLVTDEVHWTRPASDCSATTPESSREHSQLLLTDSLRKTSYKSKSRSTTQ